MSTHASRESPNREPADPGDGTTRDRWVPWVAEDGRRLALWVDGVVQSLAVQPGDEPDGYWWAMIPDQRPRSVLMLGVGACTIGHLLRERFGDLPMVGVDIDPEVLRLAREQFNLDALGMELVEGDAFEYVSQTWKTFGLICVDLFRGSHPDRRVIGRPFLRALDRILEPGGLVKFNLHRHRRAPESVGRIARVLRVVGQTTVGKNVVVTARRSQHR